MGQRWQEIQAGSTAAIVGSGRCSSKVSGVVVVAVVTAALAVAVVAVVVVAVGGVARVVVAGVSQ